MVKQLKFVAALAMAVLMSGMLGSVGAKAALAGQSALPAEELQYEWVLEDFNTDAKAAGQDMTAAQMTITFISDGSLNGVGGCTNYSGSYTVSGQSLTIGNILIATQKACPEPAM